MKAIKFEIIIASLPNREHPVAEIYYDNMYWVQIADEADDLTIQFYPHPHKKCWEFSLEEAQEAIGIAKNKLLN